MKKSKGSIEKTTNSAVLEMIGLTRSSSQEVADGYGPSIQQSELVADAKSHEYALGASAISSNQPPLICQQTSLSKWKVISLVIMT